MKQVTVKPNNKRRNRVRNDIDSSVHGASFSKMSVKDTNKAFKQLKLQQGK